jgi:membrane protein implicated in regulation of membrane protease activity
MNNKQKLSIANLILSSLIIIGALFYQDMMLAVLGLAALIFSINRYKRNFNVE